MTILLAFLLGAASVAIPLVIIALVEAFYFRRNKTEYEGDVTSFFKSDPPANP